jgi:anti-sigma-K factor RskA
MTGEHDRVRDLLAAVALGAADPEESELAESHAETCPICREELDGLRAAASVLAVDVPQIDPPPGLRDRVLGAVRAEAARDGVVAPEPPSERRWFRMPSLGRAWAPVAAVLAAAVIGLVAWNVVLQRSDEPAVTTVSISGGPTAPGISGQVVVLRDQDTAVMRLRNLPPPGAGRAYELWAIRDGRPVSAGFMTSTAGDGAVAATQDLEGVSALAVTPEPRSNTRAPTGPMVAVASLPA